MGTVFVAPAITLLKHRRQVQATQRNEDHCQRTDVTFSFSLDGVHYFRNVFEFLGVLRIICLKIILSSSARLFHTCILSKCIKYEVTSFIYRGQVTDPDKEKLMKAISDGYFELKADTDIALLARAVAGKICGGDM